MSERGTIPAKRVQETCARGVQGLPSLASKDEYTRGCGDVETLFASVRRAAGGRCLRHSNLSSACVRETQKYTATRSYILVPLPIRFYTSTLVSIFCPIYMPTQNMFGRATGIAMLFLHPTDLGTGDGFRVCNDLRVCRRRCRGPRVDQQSGRKLQQP